MLRALNFHGQLEKKLSGKSGDVLERAGSLEERPISEHLQTYVHLFADHFNKGWTTSRVRAATMFVSSVQHELPKAPEASETSNTALS